MPTVVRSLRNPARQQKLLAAFKAVAEGGHYSEGANSYQLEKQLTALLSGQHTVTLNSDGSAWYTLFKYYAEQGHGSVAIADNSFYAVGAMALEAGLKVFLVDSCPDHPSMSAESLDHVLYNNKHVKLAILNHVGGWQAKESVKIMDVCDENQVTLLEDCTDALGLQVDGCKPGLLGEASVWSFYPSKAIPAGEIGVITTPNPEIRNYARLFRQCGKHMADGRLYYGKGMSFRISEWDATVACVQLNHLNEIIEARKRDWTVLHSIAAPLVQGPSNYYKYPIEAELALPYKTVPQIYSPTDQLHACLSKATVLSANLVNSHRWSKIHRCLPLGEGLYDELTPEQVGLVLAREGVK
jgi:perosamine synthetase